MTVPAFNVINNTNKIALVINGKLGYINQEQADIAQAQLNDDELSLQDRLAKYKYHKKLAKFDKDSDEYFDFILNSL